MKDLSDYIEQHQPKYSHASEERGGRAQGVCVLIGLWRIAEAIETAAQTFGTSIEYVAAQIANEIHDGR